MGILTDDIFFDMPGALLRYSICINHIRFPLDRSLSDDPVNGEIRIIKAAAKQMNREIRIHKSFTAAFSAFTWQLIQTGSLNLKDFFL